MANTSTELKTREHYALMEQFEREHPGRHDKEPKDMWPRGVIYQSGHMNELFLTYRRGYALAKSIMLQEVQSQLDDARKQIELYRAAESWAKDDYRKLEAKLAEMGSELDRWRERYQWASKELTARLAVTMPENPDVF